MYCGGGIVRLLQAKPNPSPAAIRAATLALGSGRVIKPDDSFELSLYSLPLVGKWCFDLLRPLEPVTTEGAAESNPFQLWCGQPGTGKTNLAKLQIKQQIDAGRGGIVMDGKEGRESLSQWTVQYLAEVGWPPEKCFILDFFSPFGHPMVDLLYDDKHDAINWFQIVNELVDATTVMASSHQGLLDRGKSMARMAWQALMLSNRPANQIVRFMMDKGFQRNVVKQVAQEFDYPELELFWLGYPDFKDPDKYIDAYIDRLPRDVLESARNKWDIMTHPALRPCFSERDTKGEFAQLFHFIQDEGWWIVPLSENHLKMDFRQTIAQLAQYLLKVAALKRQEVEEKPFFLAALDEYQHYKSPITHETMLEEVARSQNIGLQFYCQNVGRFSDAEMHALGGCAVLGVFKCDALSARDMVEHIFQPKGTTYKDWKGEKQNSIQDELKQYMALVTEQKRGEAMVRVGDDAQPYFLEIPKVDEPRCSPEQERAFREAVAKRWYQPRSTTTH
jgi:hypothetical protein